MTTSNTSARECERCDKAADRTVAHHAFGGRVCLPCLTVLDRHLCVKCEDESDDRVNSDHLCTSCASPLDPARTTEAADKLIGMLPDTSTDEDW